VKGTIWRLVAAPLSALVLGWTAGSAVPASAEGVTGQWEFNGDFSAAVGTALAAAGTWSFTTQTINGQDAQVARFLASNTLNSYLNATHGIAPNGGGTKVNQYTILMDVKFDAINAFISLIQTDSVPNASDGDWFIRDDGGMGISGNYTDDTNSLRFLANTWQRIALVIDTTTPTSDGSDTTRTLYRSYINGALQNVVQSPSGWGKDGRFSLNSNVFIFADNDFEVESGYINSLQIRDYPMSANEVAALGGPSVPGLDNRKVAGVITLDKCTDMAGASLTLEFRLVDGPPFIRHVTLAADGSFSLNGIAAKKYAVAIKGSRWLQKVVTNVDATNGDVTNLDATLLPGDINNDNKVNITDLGLLADSFGKSQGQTGYNANADLNCDNKVNITDLGILADNFNRSGDP
jgi:hypothetical protein